MKPLKPFKVYIEEGTVKRITPDFNRAVFLSKEAEKRMVFLKELKEKIGIKDDNANYIVENSYNVLSEVLRSKMLESGYYASGIGAHEAEVAFMENLLFTHDEIVFMNSLRYFRNSILYYGKILDEEYGKKVLTFLDNIYPKLKKLLKVQDE